jgi:hypothetical protein
MNTDERITNLESQVRSLKRMLFGCIAVALATGVLAAQDVGAPKTDKPMRVELVGPVKVDGVGAIVTHSVKWDGVGTLPVRISGSVDVDAEVSAFGLGLTVNNVGN